MNKEEAKKILEKNMEDYDNASDEVHEALGVFDDDGSISLEGWSYFYKGMDWTVNASIAGEKDYFMISASPAKDSDDNEALTQDLFIKAGCNAQMEYMFEIEDDNLDQNAVKQKVESVFNKYGFKIDWKDNSDLKDAYDWMNGNI